MKRTLLWTITFLFASPVNAQIHNGNTPRWSIGTGYSGLATLHDDTTVTYPLGIYANLSKRVAGSTLLVASTTYHTKSEDGITTNFTGFLAGAAAIMSFGDAPVSVYASPQIGLERTGVNGTISVPGANDIELDEATTGLAYQIEGGLLIPVALSGHVKLSATFRGASYSPDAGPYNTTALIWSAGFMFTP